MLAILPFLRWAVRFAIRSTVITSATSDSTACDHLAHRGAVLAHHAQNAVARLGQSRESLERLEGGGEPAAVTFVMARGSRILAGWPA